MPRELAGSAAASHFCLSLPCLSSGTFSSTRNHTGTEHSTMRRSPALRRASPDSGGARPQRTPCGERLQTPEEIRPVSSGWRQIPPPPHTQPQRCRPSTAAGKEPRPHHASAACRCRMRPARSPPPEEEGEKAPGMDSPSRARRLLALQAHRHVEAFGPLLHPLEGGEEKELR